MRKLVNPGPYHIRAGIFSEIVGREIDVRFITESNFCTDGTEIRLPTTYNKHGWAYYYTGFEHELAHIVFDTDCMLMRDLNIKLHTDWRSAGQFIFNILEDARVDSLWGALYMGTAIRMKRIQEQCLLEIRHELLDERGPSPDMLAAQFLLIANGAIPRNKLQRYFKRCCERVKWKSFEATVVIWKRLMKVLQAISQYGTVPPRRQKINSPFAKDSDWDKKALVLIPDSDKQEPQDKGAEGGEKGVKGKDGGKQGGKQGRTGIKSRATGRNDAYRDIQKHLNKYKKEKNASNFEMKSGEMGREAIRQRTKGVRNEEKALKFAAEKAQEEINEIIAKLTKKTPSTHAKKTRADRHPLKERYNHHFEMASVSNIASIIHKNLLRYSKVGMGLSEDGCEIDIDEYLQWKLDPQRGRHEFFREEKLELGLRVTLILDQSWSMKTDHRMQRAATIAAILQLALKKTAKVEVFSYRRDANWGQTERDIIAHCDTKDLQKIRPMGWTPTAYALDWALAHGEEDKQYNERVILLVTDGWPQTDTGIENVTKNKEDTRRAVIRVKGHQVAFHAVNIKMHNVSTEQYNKNCDYMYGKSWSVVESRDIQTEIMRYVMRQVVHAIKARM